MASNKRRKKVETAEEIAERFDAGEDVFTEAEAEKAVHSLLIDLPIGMLHEVDAEAARLGIARKAVINMLIDEAMQTRALARAARRTGS